MKMIVAIIQPSKLDDVREALGKIGINGITVVKVKGCGQQKGHTKMYRGAKYEINFLSKIRLEIAVPKDQVKLVIDTIVECARSEGAGKIGDGKIFISDLQDAVRIRTGERGTEAL